MVLILYAIMLMPAFIAMCLLWPIYHIPIAYFFNGLKLSESFWLFLFVCVIAAGCVPNWADAVIESPSTVGGIEIFKAVSIYLCASFILSVVGILAVTGIKLQEAIIAGFCCMFPMVIVVMLITYFFEPIVIG